MTNVCVWTTFYPVAHGKEIARSVLISVCRLLLGLKRLITGDAKTRPRQWHAIIKSSTPISDPNVRRNSQPMVRITSSTLDKNPRGASPASNDSNQSVSLREIPGIGMVVLAAFITIIASAAAHYIQFRNYGKLIWVLPNRSIHLIYGGAWQYHVWYGFHIP